MKLNRFPRSEICPGVEINKTFFFKMSRMRKEESEKEERELKKEKGMNRKEWKRQREEDIERKEE